MNAYHDGRARPILFYLTVVKVPGMIPSTLKFTIPLYNNNPGVAITADCYHRALTDKVISPRHILKKRCT
ncbi:uncharacterized protein LOC142318748 isoform X9 [Lycorma delicatula]|uniref:uncharacterized protein LOC142318748 isoform X9 n=1 Tax=Lycorma delicatula TaxID=130591 RepID=UPI003F512F21